MNDSDPDFEQPVAEQRKYPGDPVASFQTGAMIDLRARIALDLLKTPLYADLVKLAATNEELQRQPGVIVGHVLELSGVFVAECERRGWVEPLPMDVADQEQRIGATGAIEARLRAHAELSGLFQAAMNIALTEAQTRDRKSVV